MSYHPITRLLPLPGLERKTAVKTALTAVVTVPCYEINYFSRNFLSAPNYAARKEDFPVCISTP
jgi:hypothetical protein